MSITKEEVVARRTSLGWSRKKLAEESGLTEGKIWRIENKGNMTAEEADAVTAALAVSGQVDRSVLPPQSSPVAPVPPLGIVDRPLLLTPVEEDNSPKMPCGHTEKVHGPDDLCPRHPRNDDFRLVSNSEMRTFKRCRRKWWLGWYRGLKMKHESPIGPREIGKRVHRALREWYVPEGQPRTDPREALELLIAQDWTAVVLRFRAAGLEITPELQKKFTQEANLERAMISGYMEWLAETGEDAEIVVTAPETYLEVDVTDDKDIQQPKQTKLIAKIDVRVKRTRDGVRFFVDHKTVGDFVTPAALLPLDEQMLDYHLLEWLSTEEGEERCHAALYNMLRKVKRGPTAKPPFYRRLEVHHSEIELQSFKERALSTVVDMHAAEKRLDDGESPQRVAYPNPTRDCKWDCDFLQLCGMFDDGSRVEAMLDQYYTTGDSLSYYMTDTGLGNKEGEII